MATRIYVFDAIRVIAVISVILCHFLIYSGIDVNLGRYLGGGGNFVFFSLSALLFGLKWDTDGKLPFKAKSFLIIRMVRLGASLWPFLIIIGFLFIINGVDFSWTSMALNFSFLGYVAKLPGNGHLWFLTILMACYLEFLLLSRLRINKSMLSCIIAVGVLLFFIFEYLHVPGQHFLTLAACAYLFFHTKKFLEYVNSINIILCLSCFIAINAFSIWIYSFGLFESCRIVAFIIRIFYGFSWLILLVRLIPDKGIIIWHYGGDISYEVYIVHMLFISGPVLNVLKTGLNSIEKFFAILLLSIVSAVILHFISRGIRQILSMAIRKV